MRRRRPRRRSSAADSRGLTAPCMTRRWRRDCFGRCARLRRATGFLPGNGRNSIPSKVGPGDHAAFVVSVGRGGLQRQFARGQNRAHGIDGVAAGVKRICVVDCRSAFVCLGCGAEQRKRFLGHGRAGEIGQEAFGGIGGFLLSAWTSFASMPPVRMSGLLSMMETMPNAQHEPHGFYDFTGVT